jgi:hypothetical protein
MLIAFLPDPEKAGDIITIYGWEKWDMEEF